MLFINFLILRLPSILPFQFLSNLPTTLSLTFYVYNLSIFRTHNLNISKWYRSKIPSKTESSNNCPSPTKFQSPNFNSSHVTIPSTGPFSRTSSADKAHFPKTFSSPSSTKLQKSSVFFPLWRTLTEFTEAKRSFDRCWRHPRPILWSVETARKQDWRKPLHYFLLVSRWLRW